MVPAEGATIEAKAEGCLPARGNVKLAPAHKTTIIFYEGPAEKSPDDEKPKPRLRIFQTQVKPATAQIKEYGWPTIYLGEAPSVQLVVNGEPVQLDRGKTKTLAPGKNAIDIRQGERRVAGVSVEQPVDYLIVLYGDAAEVQGGVVYR